MAKLQIANSGVGLGGQEENILGQGHLLETDNSCIGY